jgi:7-carboxy-7-deazaguanine synthase
MKSYAYSEIFYSVQGEGFYTGQTSAWLRFYLCNLQCDGFGQDDPTDPSTYDLPYENFDPLLLKDVTELPVWERGCDSSYSWAKKFRHLQKKETGAEIVESIRKSMVNEFNPDGDFIHPFSKQRAHLVLTGGEPLMKHAQSGILDMWEAYKSKPDKERPRNITFETNGTQPLTDDFVNSFSNRGFFSGELFFSCSPKLFTVSGEENKRAILPHVIKQYDDLATLNRIRTQDTQAPNGQLKFVMGTKKEQWDELDTVIKQIRDAGVDWPVWIMPLGATVEGQKMIDGDVANMAQARGYCVSARVHTYLWGNVIGV